MIPITFLPMNKKIEIKEGQSILDAALGLEIDINSECTGKGTCGKCKVLVTKGNNPNEIREELKFLSESQLKSGIRLGCKFRPTEETCVLLTQTNTREIRKEEKKYKVLPKEEMGVVFDIGTTTVEMGVYNLETNEKVVQLWKKNPQKIGGTDVVTRMMYSLKKQKNLYQMQNLIHRCCNELLNELLFLFQEKDRERAKEKLIKMVVTGNTTMTHLFLGKSVEGLSKAPFRPAFTGVAHFLNKNGTFHISSGGEVMILPNISGHIGSDTLGCMYAVDLENQTGVQFILDIGTNAEMVLLHNGRMYCCSVAAGPAFEGAAIYQGMQAVDGAIKAVRVKNGELILDVVGGQIPKGICGSGMIDSVSVMLEEGRLDKTGKMLKEKEFILYSGDEKVILTQKDIREIQLAKAAIFAGISTLLEKNQLTVCEIDKFYLAGTFGSNINLENAKKIGLIPKVNTDKIELIGNGAIEGARRILVQQISELAVEESSKKVEHVELADSETFRDYFIKGIDF